MRRSTLLVVALLVAAASPAFAGSKVSVESMTVDGLEVRSLACDLKSGGLFAIAEVVGALSKQKQGLDACAMPGAAFVLEWTWADGKVTSATVKQSSSEGANACVLARIKETKGPNGTCSAMILAGDAKGAAAAADKLAPPAKPAP